MKGKNIKNKLWAITFEYEEVFYIKAKTREEAEERSENIIYEAVSDLKAHDFNVDIGEVEPIA